MKPPSILVTLLASGTFASAATYAPTSTSLATHRAAPEWFQDAKWGVWFHWGVFCTPMYGSEWYPRNMYYSGSGENNHHKSVYGDPNGAWNYSKFLTGANDAKGNFVQFAPKLPSAGGKFDPEAWARLFDSAGAKIAGAVAQHHDGVALWDSKVNPWNTMRYGPKLDLAGLFADAFRAHGMKVMLSMHHAWNYNGYYQYVPAQTDTGLKRLFGQMTKTVQHQYWYDQLKEIVDQYQPDYIWQDFSVNNVPEATRLQFLAYYYNKEAQWGRPVAASYNDGYNTSTAIHQYERGGPADITNPYWMSEDAISSTTWGYTQGMKYYATSALLHRLLDIVSKNGTLILNISPMPDGTIPAEQRTILLAMGDWLRKFGSSVYGTRIWSVYGEGPTKMGGTGMGAPVTGTGKDVRYTKSKNGSAVYAIFLGWPGNGTKFNLTGLNASRLKLTAHAKVELMGDKAGSDLALPFTQDGTGLQVSFPATTPFSALAYVVRVRLTTDTSATTSPTVRVYKNNDFDGLLATLTEGSYTKAQLAALGVTDNDISSMEVDDGLKVELFDADAFQTPLGSYTASLTEFGSIGANDKVTSLRISKASSAVSVRGGARIPPAAWSRGVLSVTPSFDGTALLADPQGRLKTLSLKGGKCLTGPLAPGAYRVVLDPPAAAANFVVTGGN